MTSKIIKVNINNEDYMVLVLRKRTNNASKEGYAPLIKNIVAHMTENQIDNIINNINDTKMIRYDDILDSFKFSNYQYQLEDGDMEQCICGKSIRYPYYITNKETCEEICVGSTCCENWRKRNLAPAKAASNLKICFNVLKKNKDNSPRFRFGKYKNCMIKTVIKNQCSYCRWVIKEFKDKRKELHDVVLAMMIEDRIYNRKIIS
jgi:hypothetical protein